VKLLYYCFSGLLFTSLSSSFFTHPHWACCWHRTLGKARRSSSSCRHGCKRCNFSRTSIAAAVAVDESFEISRSCCSIGGGHTTRLDTTRHQVTPPKATKLRRRWTAGETVEGMTAMLRRDGRVPMTIPVTALAQG
jgi:hypothetical protein